MRRFAVRLQRIDRVRGQRIRATPIDFAKVEIKTIDLGNKTYRLDGRGRQHHGRGRHGRHHHRRQPVRAALRQDQGGDHGDLAAAGQIPDHHALSRRSHRRESSASR